MSRDVVEKILKTSQAIDQMRAETDTIVKIVIGLIEKTGNWQAIAKTNPLFYVGEGAHWQLGVFGRGLEVRYVRDIVSDDRFVTNNRQAIIVDYSSTASWINGVRFGNRIDYAWKTLPAFVGWTLRTFPTLAEDMDSFFERGAMT